MENVLVFLSRLATLFPTKQDIDSVVSHDREGFPTNMKEQEFLSMYKMGKLLGKGKYASVHLCTYNPTKEKRAMKIFSKRGQGGTKDKIYKIIKEAIYTRRAAHAHVTKVFDLIETKERLLIIFEVVEGGELYKEVLRRKHFSEVTYHVQSLRPDLICEWKETANKVVVQMADALCHMHANHLIHCDLKPENVLCTSNPETGKDWDIKITDFGLSKPIIEDDDHSDLTFCGSPLYMAPEMLFKQVCEYIYNTV